MEQIFTALDWIKQNASHVGEDCLLWPYSGNWNGYGHLGIDGKTRKAHRVMCEVAHGLPPSVKHIAAHSCNNRGCVNRNHLSWKTPRENQLDRRKHGTAKRRTVWSRADHKVTESQKKEIAALKGYFNQREIGDMYDISYQHVSLIQRGLTRQP